MDRNPSPRAPRVYTEAEPSIIFVHATTDNFMEIVQRLTGQPAPTDTAAAAVRGAIVPMLPVESVQQHQSMLATATAPEPGASSLVLQPTLSLSPPLSTGNPGPCVLNMAPDPRSLATSSSETESIISEGDEEMEEDDEEMEDDDEEMEVIREGRFYLLPSPQSEEPKLLNLFPLTPSSGEGN